MAEVTRTGWRSARPRRRGGPVRIGALCAAVLACAAAGTAGAQARSGTSAPPPPWSVQLKHELEGIALAPGAELGVHVHDLATGASVDHHAQERWYLASMVKLPVAIAVLRGIESDLFTLDTTLRLRADDRVDGAGRTNAQPLAAPLTLRFLLEQMMIHSDNTASDMLIGLVGLDAVHAVVASLSPEGFEPITTLADVRRQIYGQLTPEASRLRGGDLLRLRTLASDEERLALLAQLVNVPQAQFRRPSLESAYAGYYRSGLNSARLDAYGRLLAGLVQVRALGPEQTAWLLALMERTRTGAHRIKAGLPAEARFAHKTGTQRKRICDAGLLRHAAAAPAAGIVVVACVRGDASLGRAEAALRQVGQALCRSGLLTRETHHAPTCPAPPPARRGDAASAAAAPAAVLAADADAGE